MQLQKARCGLVSTVSKVHVYTPSGDYTEMPEGIPIAEDGLELVGVFHSANEAACIHATDEKLNGKIAADGSRSGGKLTALNSIDKLAPSRRH